MALCGAVCLPIICIACKQHQSNGLEPCALPVVHALEDGRRKAAALTDGVTGSRNLHHLPRSCCKHGKHENLCMDFRSRAPCRGSKRMYNMPLFALIMCQTAPTVFSRQTVINTFNQHSRCHTPSERDNAVGIFKRHRTHAYTQKGASTVH